MPPDDDRSTDSELERKALDIAAQVRDERARGLNPDIHKLCAEYDDPELESLVREMLAKTPALPPSAPPPGDEPMPAQIGRYVLYEQIGCGGMGVVYRGRDHELKRDVAVKVVQARRMDRPQIAERFRQESQLTAQLQHPAVPPVYEVGTLPEDGRPWVAMKLVKGRNLAELLQADAAKPVGERLDRLSVFEAVCQGVGYAHKQKRVIHRDLKPANVMVGKFGEVHVLDWGLSKVLGSPDRRPAVDPNTTNDTELAQPGAGSSRTSDGAVLGSLPYMAKEQALGLNAEVNEQSDVFGLGAILCELLAGRPPYVGPDRESVRALAVRGRVQDAFAALDACGAEPDLVVLCKRCLAPERDDRPKDAGEVSQALAAWRLTTAERARQAEVDLVREEV